MDFLGKTRRFCPISGGRNKIFGMCVEIPGMLEAVQGEEGIPESQTGHGWKSLIPSHGHLPLPQTAPRRERDEKIPRKCKIQELGRALSVLQDFPSLIPAPFSSAGAASSQLPVFPWQLRGGFILERRHRDLGNHHQNEGRRMKKGEEPLGISLLLFREGELY